MLVVDEHMRMHMRMTRARGEVLLPYTTQTKQIINDHLFGTSRMSTTSIVNVRLQVLQRSSNCLVMRRIRRRTLSSSDRPHNKDTLFGEQYVIS